MLETLDAAAVRRWCGGGLEALRAHQHEIDELNVYPVPDGDTGTNLVLTLTAAQEALDRFLAESAGSGPPEGRAEPETSEVRPEPAASDRPGDQSARPASPGGADGPATSPREAGATASSVGIGAPAGRDGRGDRPSPVSAHSLAEPARPTSAPHPTAPPASRGGPASPGSAPSPGSAAAGDSPASAGWVSSDGPGGPVEGAALVGEVLDPVESAPATLGRAMRRMARGALLGARGNSGVIVSQILRGMADSFSTSVAVRGGELARALRTATEAAYGAVARPVEGTVLSVVAAAAEGAGRIKSDDLLAVARAAARSASEALARTPQQLPALARAGVVDAGGRGLCLLLDALVEALGPAAPTRTDVDPGPAGEPHSSVAGSSAAVDDSLAVGSSPAGAGGAGGRAPVDRFREAGSSSGADRTHEAVRSPAVDRSAEAGRPYSFPEWHSTDEGVFGFEVQYLLDAEDAAVDGLRRVLDGIGDSLVVVGTGDGAPPTWNVHVHVAAEHIGPAVEAGLAAGRPYRITVTPLDERVAGPHSDAAEKTASGDLEADESRGAVVVAAGDGLTALFEAEGAVVVGRNPSIGEMLAAITTAGWGSVVLLPNDANTHAVATAAAREAERAGVRVSVVPTRSPVQALAALAVRDNTRPFADDVIGMAEAAGACRYGEVCTAQRAALTVAGACRAGDLLGLVDGEVHVIGADLEDVSRRLVDRMLGGGGELVTLVLGADAPAGLGQLLAGHLTQTWPFVELQSYAGGQPRYHLLVGVE